MNVLFSLINKLRDFLISCPTLYVKLYKNEVEIKHLESGVTIKRKSTSFFSNERLLIADFLVFELFFKDLVDELLNRKSKVLKKGLTVLFQPMSLDFKEVTPVESRVYVDSMYFGGARRLCIYGKQKQLTDMEVLELLGKKEVFINE